MSSRSPVPAFSLMILGRFHHIDIVGQGVIHIAAFCHNP
jgi:hypothetical protein